MRFGRKQREHAGLGRAALQGTVCGAGGRTQSGFCDHGVRRVRDLHESAKSETTQGLEQLRDWLRGDGCMHFAMESTGVYGKPVWHLLEGSFILILAHRGAEGTPS